MSDKVLRVATKEVQPAEDTQTGTLTD